jgi:alanyl-tRNA synthetase
MLGNFSFGDYFKTDAIDFAWELVTGKEFYGLDPARLWATVYTDDDEAARLWNRYLPEARVVRFGEKDNFWSMGETGPCGPCSELHYDQGPEVPGDDRPNGRGDRVIEIWNLVFMQFDRDASGRTAPLPKPSVDTGAGLERITAILQGKNNNYDTDLFEPVMRKLEEISGHRYRGGMAVEDAPFRVIADHARAATMLIADGVIPANDGRGYVLRRIIRRAVRYGRRLGLGLKVPFLHELLLPTINSFKGIFFEIDDTGKIAFSLVPIRSMSQALFDEENRFLRTVSAGVDRVGEAISDLRRSGGETIPGQTVFRFYDTFGIPLELIEELARDEGVSVDHGGFEEELIAARARSKAAAKFEPEILGAIEQIEIGADWTTEFRGYPEDDFLALGRAEVRGVFKDSAPWIYPLREGDEAIVIFDKTIFYPEGGGQVADTGRIIWPEGSATVLDVRKGPAGRWILHRIRVEKGRLAGFPGDPSGERLVKMQVDEWTRRKTQANHTGTHLLHAALRRVLDESVRQMGSLVAPDRLRFDYAAPRATSAAELAEIERLVNEEVLRDLTVTKSVMPMEDARARGALMFFGEKYGERVRVVDVPGVSTELCGGCHVSRTGEIGAFKIVSDRGLSAGVRRIEAVTALGAVERLSRDEAILAELSEAVQAAAEELPGKVKELSQKLREHEKEIARLKVALATTSASPSASGAGTESTRDVSGVQVLVRRVPSLPMNELRNLADTFRGKLKSGVVLLGTDLDGKATLLAAVTTDLTSRVSAHELAQTMAVVVGGKGGGKPDLAQAGGKDPGQLEAALEAGVAKVRERLGGGA